MVNYRWLAEDVFRVIVNLSGTDWEILDLDGTFWLMNKFE
jgi:hypothetical protein